MPERQLVHQSQGRATKNRILAAGLQPTTSAQFVGLLAGPQSWCFRRADHLRRFTIMLRLETVVPQPWFQDTDLSTGFAGPDLIVRRFLPPFSTKIKAVIGRYPSRALHPSRSNTFLGGRFSWLLRLVLL